MDMFAFTDNHGNEFKVSVEMFKINTISIYRTQSTKPRVYMHFFWFSFRFLCCHILLLKKKNDNEFKEFSLDFLIDILPD